MQRIRRFGGATVVVALVVMALSAVLIAPAAGALSMKACQLVTLKDVQGVLGDGYTAKNMVENEIMSQCAYTKGKKADKEAAVPRAGIGGLSDRRSAFSGDGWRLRSIFP